MSIKKRTFATLMEQHNIRNSLISYIEGDIIPQYAHFDRAHNEEHARTVIKQSLALAGLYPEVDVEMVYTAAACHDIGLAEGREYHHIASSRMIRQDATLRRFFNDEQVEVIAQAAEDHRASAKHEPRSIYGRIVAEADRNIDCTNIVRRTVQYGLDHYPELDREGHWQRALQHLNEKYAEGGYLKLWIPESLNAQKIKNLHNLIKDEVKLRRLFENLYNELRNDHPATT